MAASVIAPGIHSLYDVAEFVNGRSTKPSETVPTGVPVVKIAQLTSANLASADQVSPEAVAEKHWIRDGDLLFAWSGSVGIHTYRGPAAALNQHIFRVSAAPGVDQEYLKYLLLSQLPTFRGFVEDKRTTMGHVTVANLRSMQVDIPPMGQQRRIAHILGTLDNKIELNRRRNETLEAMSRALFKSWFVDFDPVRAKAEGRDPGLPKHLADLFPERLVESEFGEIPEGWLVNRLDNDFTLTMGQSPPGDTYNSDGRGLPFYQGRSDFGPRYPSPRVYCSAPTRLAAKGDTLVSVRAPVGDINVASEASAIGRGVAAVHHKSGAVEYTFQSLRNLAPVLERFNSEGTVFGSISKRDFHSLAVVAPPTDVIAAYESKASAFTARLWVAEESSRALAELCDVTLAQLFRGSGFPGDDTK